MVKLQFFFTKVAKLCKKTTSVLFVCLFVCFFVLFFVLFFGVFVVVVVVGSWATGEKKQHIFGTGTWSLATTSLLGAYLYKAFMLFFHCFPMK